MCSWMHFLVSRSALAFLLSMSLNATLSSADAAADSDADAGTCCACETCHGFGEWVYGVGWLIPPYRTEVIGRCLQREREREREEIRAGVPPTSAPTPYEHKEQEQEQEQGQGHTAALPAPLPVSVQVPGGQGDAVQEAMKAVYDNVRELGMLDLVRPGTATASDGDASASSASSIARALSAALPGATAVNSEGLYYCVTEAETETETDEEAVTAKAQSQTQSQAADAFYWVVNCNVLLLDLSGNAALCQDLTDAERTVGPVGFVVDPHRTGSSGFRRYVFNESFALPTLVQPIEAGSTEFRCSDRPWYEMGTSCEIDEGPAKVLCPTTFQGTKGLGTFQVYGSAGEGVVVSQDIATWQLCQCLDDLDCTAAAAAAASSSSAEPRFGSVLRGAAATAILCTSSGVICLSLLVLVL